MIELEFNLSVWTRGFGRSNYRGANSSSRIGETLSKSFGFYGGEFVGWSQDRNSIDHVMRDVVGCRDDVVRIWDRGGSGLRRSCRDSWHSSGS